MTERMLCNLHAGEVILIKDILYTILIIYKEYDNMISIITDDGIKRTFPFNHIFNTP